ncbi:MAG: putative quinol monooxygenase [Pseudomonadota bacterium]
MPELAVLARITPLPQHRAAARDALIGILAPTRAEPGCRQFDLHDGEGDGTLWLVERWDDDAALEAHYALPHVRAVFAAYENWLACPPEITRLRPAV